MLPKKTEYMVSEMKADLVKTVEKSRELNLGDIKELKSYIHTLHGDI